MPAQICSDTYAAMHTHTKINHLEHPERKHFIEQWLWLAVTLLDDQGAVELIYRYQLCF